MRSPKLLQAGVTSFVVRGEPQEVELVLERARARCSPSCDRCRCFGAPRGDRVRRVRTLRIHTAAPRRAHAFSAVAVPCDMLRRSGRAVHRRAVLPRRAEGQRLRRDECGVRGVGGADDRLLQLARQLATAECPRPQRAEAGTGHWSTARASPRVCAGRAQAEGGDGRAASLCRSPEAARRRCPRALALSLQLLAHATYVVEVQPPPRRCSARRRRSRSARRRRRGRSSSPSSARGGRRSSR